MTCNVWGFNILVLLMLVLGTSFSQAQQSQKPSFRWIWSVGDDNESDHLLLGGPQQASFTKDGKILLVDYPKAELLILSPEGTLLGSVGTRGQGPGEFQEITSFTVSDKGKIVIFDRLNGRISVYTDKFLLSHEISHDGSKGAPSKMVSLAQEKIAAYYLDYSAFAIRKDGEVIHVFDHSFENSLQSFGLMTEIWDLDIPLIKNTAGNPRGAYITRISNEAVVLVPYVYQGKLFKFNISAKSGPPHVFKGTQGNIAAYSLVDSNPSVLSQQEKRGLWSISGPAGRTVARINVSSRGVLSLPDGTFLNFTVRLESNSAIAVGRLFLEHFDSSGNLLGSGPVTNYPVFDKTSRLAFSALAAGNDGSILIADESSGSPRLHKIAVEW